MDPDFKDLPCGWKWKTLGDIAEVIGGGTPSTRDATNFGGNIPWLTPADLSRYTSKFISHGERFITEHGLKTSSAKMMPVGSVLFTSRAPIGYVAIASTSLCTNQGFKSFVLKEGVLPDYLYWWLKGNKELAESFASGTTFLELSGTKAKQLPIPIPSTTEEQEQIVAEIEKQFSRLDETVTALKQIQANLKRYKATVLKAAVEGKLTEEWRRKNVVACSVGAGLKPASTKPAPTPIETGDELLKRILVERRAKWEDEELAKMKAKGIKPKDDSWKKKYKEPARPDTANLPELPEGWVWARLDTIAALKGGITVDKKRKDPTARLVPYLRVANVQRGYLDLTEMKEIEAPQSTIEELSLLTGDILFNEGGDRDKLGRGWIWEGQLAECIHQNHVFRARLYERGLSSDLISWWGNTFGKDFFLRAGKQTTNLASINLTKLSEFPVPLLPLSEQHQIVEEVERRLSVTEELEATIETNLKRVERLRQTILKKAFCGEILS